MRSITQQHPVQVVAASTNDKTHKHSANFAVLHVLITKTCYTRESNSHWNSTILLRIINTTETLDTQGSLQQKTGAGT